MCDEGGFEGRLELNVCAERNLSRELQRCRSTLVGKELQNGFFHPLSYLFVCLYSILQRVDLSDCPIDSIPCPISISPPAMTTTKLSPLLTTSHDQLVPFHLCFYFVFWKRLTICLNDRVTSQTIWSKHLDLAS